MKKYFLFTLFQILIVLGISLFIMDFAPEKTEKALILRMDNSPYPGIIYTVNVKSLAEGTTKEILYFLNNGGKSDVNWAFQDHRILMFYKMGGQWILEKYDVRGALKAKMSSEDREDIPFPSSEQKISSSKYSVKLIKGDLSESPFGIRILDRDQNIVNEFEQWRFVSWADDNRLIYEEQTNDPMILNLGLYNMTNKIKIPLGKTTYKLTGGTWETYLGMINVSKKE